MAASKPQKEQRLPKLLFNAHTFIYLGVLTVALLSSFGTWFGFNPFTAMAVVWSFVYLVHSRTYYMSTARSTHEVDARQAYREGYKDAMREAGLMTDVQQPQVPARVWLDDEGELVYE